jgi:hypothetical protein
VGNSDDIILTDEDIDFIVEQMEFAFTCSERSFSRRLINTGGQNSQADSEKLQRFQRYRTRMQDILTKLKGDKRAEERTNHQPSSSPRGNPESQGRQGQAQEDRPGLGRPREPRG